MSQNSVGGISDFRISGQPLMKRNCHNSQTSDENDMKLGTVIKLDKRNKTTSKKKMMVASCQEIMTSLPFFQFTANLEQSERWIPDARSPYFLKLHMREISPPPPCPPQPTSKWTPKKTTQIRVNYTYYRRII